MTGKSVLVLGGAGFLGRALSERLSGGGGAVHVIAPGERDPGLPESVTVHRARLDDQPLLRELLPSCRCVVHAASASTPGTTRGDPLGECSANVLPTLGLLEVLQDHAHVGLVYLSSGGAVYGEAPAGPVDETTVLAPRSFYGAGKAACEAFLHAYAGQLARPVIALRPSNLYGPGQPARKGFGIVRKLLDCARDAQPVEIWGDGSALRDYLYIDDLVDACVRAVEHVLRRDAMSTYNVCSGTPQSLDGLCDLVESVTGRSLERRYRPGRSVDVRHNELDAARIRAELGWKPAVGLAEGIARTWAWLSEQRDAA